MTNPIFATIRRETVAATQYRGPALWQNTRYFDSSRSWSSLTISSFSARVLELTALLHGPSPGGTQESLRDVWQISQRIKQNVISETPMRGVGGSVDCGSRSSSLMFEGSYGSQNNEHKQRDMVRRLSEYGAAYETQDQALPGRAYYEALIHDVDDAKTFQQRFMISMKKKQDLPRYHRKILKLLGPIRSLQLSEPKLMMRQNTITEGKRIYIKNADLPPTSSTHLGIERCKLELGSISMKAQRLCDSNHQTCEGPVLGQTWPCTSELPMKLPNKFGIVKSSYNN